MNNINNRYKRIEEVLEHLKNIAIQNPKFDFSTEAVKNYVYKEITRFGIDSKTRKINLSEEGIFDKWIKHYKRKSNINVFVGDNWRYFCQFTNKREKFGNFSNDAIKIYIPLDYTHIERGATRIFDFLRKKNITHCSKVGKNIRVDNLVIRVSNDEDAKLLLAFVNNDEYIQEGLIEPNPFPLNEGKIAITSDRRMSYNSIISSMLSIYLDKRKKEEQLDKINLVDFVSFTSSYFNSRFNNYEDIDHTLEDFYIIDEDDYENMNDFKFMNVKEVLDLFLKSLDPNFTFENYVERFKNESSSKKFYEKVNEFTLKKNGMNIEDTVENTTEDTVDEEENKYFDLLLIDAIDSISSKYDLEHAFKVIESYLITGDPRVLTRNNDIRNKISSTSFRTYFNEFLSSKNIKLSNYYSIINREKIESYLKDAIYVTYNKYQKLYDTGFADFNGEEFAIGAVTRLISTGSYAGFTRENSCRDNLEKNVSIKDAILIVKEKTNHSELENDLVNLEDGKILAREYVSLIMNEKLEKERTVKVSNF